MKIVRVGSMVEGLYCPILVNNVSKHYIVHSNNNGKLFISYKGKKLYEDDLPMGEEIEI